MLDTSFEHRVLSSQESVTLAAMKQTQSFIWHVMEVQHTTGHHPSSWSCAHVPLVEMYLLLMLGSLCIEHVTS